MANDRCVIRIKNIGGDSWPLVGNSVGSWLYHRVTGGGAYVVRE